MRNAPFLFSKQRQAANVPSTRRGDCYGRRCGVFSRKAPRKPNNRHSGCFILCFAEDSVRRRQNIPFNSQSLRDCRDFSCPPLSATKNTRLTPGTFLWPREGDSELSRASCAALIAARLRGFLLPTSLRHKKHPACTGCFLWRREGDSELSRASCAALIAARLRGFLLPTSLRHKKHPACTGCFLWRREGDSNSRSGITRTHDFQSCALDQLSHLSNTTILLYYFFSRLSRAFREKNPCFSMFLGAICKNRFLPCRSVETGPHGISRRSCGQSPAREPAGRRSRKRAPPPSRKALTRPKL